jgi:hypothetical protein
MKSIIFLALALLVNAECAFAYKIYCRTGGPMVLTLWEQPGTGWVAKINFERATVAAQGNVSRIKAGQCAWADRVVAPNEPAVISSFMQNNVAKPEHQIRVKDKVVENLIRFPGVGLQTERFFNSTGDMFTIDVNNNGQELISAMNAKFMGGADAIP